MNRHFIFFNYFYIKKTINMSSALTILSKILTVSPIILTVITNIHSKFFQEIFLIN